MMEMIDKKTKTLTFDGFVSRYMQNADEAFAYEKKAIQIYPLSIASSFIKPPVPLFRADYNFLLLFRNGGGRQQVNNEFFDLCTNDVLFIREGYLNAIKEIRPDTDGFFIYIDNTLLPQLFSKKDVLHRFTFHPKHTVTADVMEWLCKCCELLLPERNPAQPHDLQLAILKAVIIKLTAATSQAFSRPDRQSEVTISFKELLHKHFALNRDVKFYADQLSVSENYLNRCVKSVTNKPPKIHIVDMVIAQSKIMLQDRSKDISEIAFNLNFADPSHFGRVFKKMTGQTPSQYRDTAMQDLSGY
jgi:AraC family transcriptional regulator, transcriptional activator of pobA